MKRKRKALLLILAAVFFAGSIAAAYAAVETQTGIKNTVSTGGISIDIDTFTDVYKRQSLFMETMSYRYRASPLQKAAKGFSTS